MAWWVLRCGLTQITGCARSASGDRTPPGPRPSGFMPVTAKGIVGGMPGLGNTVAAHDFPQGHPENPQIQPEAAVVHVPDVEAKLVVPFQGIAAIDLGPARDAGPHRMTPELFKN